ncbi:MAG: hypothetical protein L0154_21435 [Chloroflexi bacterium]|nr:hypothetical protein [Chloroflexota bacterium]
MVDVADLNADKNFFEVSELAVMSLEELQILWDSVPTEDQAYLVRVFEREADKRQVVEDLDECRMARHFLEQYQQMGFVPAADVWLKVPVAVREQYRLPFVDETAVDETTHGSNAAAPLAKKSGLPKWLLLLALPFACLVIFAVIRMATAGSRRSDEEAVSVLPSATPSPTATLTPTITPSPLPPTATPFSLSGFDDTIASGERASRDYYPVQLQVFPNRQTLPRVYIVQEQDIAIAEWRFDPNPDVVSWLSGMIIRPVLGVPFSPANLDLFRSLDAESVFVVTMNTGDVLQFVFAERRQVGRAETAFFQQDKPGLVLVLMGETFADGSPTDLRYLVEASYPIHQEIARLQADAQASVVPMGTSQFIEDSSLTVQDARLVASNNLPPDLAYALIDVQVLSTSNAVSPSAWQWWLELPASERLTLDPNASAVGTCASVNTDIPAATATCVSLGFITANTIENGRLLVTSNTDEETVFDVQFTPVALELSASSLDVQLERVSYTTDSLTVEARIFNATEEALTITATDISLILGFVPQPSGMTIHPAFEPATLQPTTAMDISLNFPYSGEGYGMLTMMERVWAIQIQ